MRVAVAAGMALLLIGLPSWGQAQGKVCDNPRPMSGFKTCADVEKAEAEGAFVLYSTDPEAGQVKLDDAIQSYERGAQLKRHCEQKLNEAQQRVERIVIGGDGAITAEPAKLD